MVKWLTLYLGRQWQMHRRLQGRADLLVAKHLLVESGGIDLQTHCPIPFRENRGRRQ
jgi:dihydroorotase-like cyclic amidohydrolase